MLMHNNNKLKGHLFLNGTELITWLWDEAAIRPCFYTVAEKRDQYLMNSKRRIFRNINVSHTWAHKVTSSRSMNMTLRTAGGMHLLNWPEHFKLIQTTIKMDWGQRGTFRPRISESFLLCGPGSPCDPALCFNYRCLLLGSSGNTTNTVEKWKKKKQLTCLV